MSSKSLQITLKCFPRYNFLQNIYNSKLLFCIFWDKKSSYIRSNLLLINSVLYKDVTISLHTKCVITFHWMCVFKLCQMQKHASVLIRHSFWFSHLWQKCNGRRTAALWWECLKVLVSKLYLGEKTLKCWYEASASRTETIWQRHSVRVFGTTPYCDFLYFLDSAQCRTVNVAFSVQTSTEDRESAVRKTRGLLFDLLYGSGMTAQQQINCI